MIHKYLILSCFMLISLNCFPRKDVKATNLPLDENSKNVSTDKGASTNIIDADFYIEPTVFGVEKNLQTDYQVNNTDNSDDSNRLQKAINEISATTNGGKLIIPAGKYYFSGIKIKSNVHIEIDENAIIYPTDQNDGKNHIIFQLGQDAALAENISVIGEGKGFTVEFRNTTDKKLAVFALGNVKNFKLSNFTIQDNQTIFASILVNLSEYNSQYSWSKNGIIEKARNFNANLGYGLVQTYAADNILFRDVYSQGGVCLRFETDNLKMKKVGVGGIRNVYGKDIRSEDGLAAVMFSPHFMTNGKVVINDVHSKNSCFAVRVEEGFVEIFNEPGETKKDLIDRVENLIGFGSISIIYKRGADKNRWAARLKNEYSQIAFEKTGLKPGSFEESTVNNITAEYGESAQFKANFLNYLTCSERQKICQSYSNGNSYKGPSVAATYDSTIEGAKFGSYVVHLNNISAIGFPNPDRISIKRNTPTYVCPSFIWHICK
ncbi:MAG: glycosyl hydrolase family 28-related protein [Bacteroidales bacterium]